MRLTMAPTLTETENCNKKQILGDKQRENECKYDTARDMELNVMQAGSSRRQCPLFAARWHGSV
jgi:hypothetical protein